jgi:hypothetical protein
MCSTGVHTSRDATVSLYARAKEEVPGAGEETAQAVVTAVVVEDTTKSGEDAAQAGEETEQLLTPWNTFLILLKKEMMCLGKCLYWYGT